MENLQPSNGAATFTPIEYSGQRVLLTSQLAFGYGTTPKVISNNYNRHAEKYTAGVHFFMLEGQEKRDFCNRHQFEDSYKNAATLYLWTERGTLLHAKSLGTEQAWNTHEKLVDTYFRARENAAQIASFSPQLQALMAIEIRQQAIEAKQEEQRQRIDAAARQMRDIRENVRYNPDTWREDTTRKIRAIAQARGIGYAIVWGEAYKALEVRGHCNLDTQLKHMKERALQAGQTKTAAGNLCRLDVIEKDPRLLEIFTKIVTEMAITEGIPASMEPQPQTTTAGRAQA